MQSTTDILCFSHLRWGFVFQRPNHLMSRFARHARTFFFEEPLFDRDLTNGAPRLDLEETEHGVLVCTPILPEGTPPELVVELQSRLLSELIEQQKIKPGVLWFYTPMALTFTRELSAPVVVYDCMDELSAFLGAPPELCELENQLFARANVVFTGGHSLYESKRQRHHNVHAFPSSVDAEHFLAARSTLADPADQKSLPRPRLGFFGVVDERLDLELLLKLADARPSYQIVIVGPVVKIDPKSLPERPNLHWLGKQDYSELPRYLANWDVALMPFALNDSTRFISPTKTLEYLAAGKPVVSTAIKDVIHPYGDAGAVQIANHDTFVHSVDQALASSPEARLRIANDFLARTSWDKTWNRMRALLAKASPQQHALKKQLEEGMAEHV